MDTIDQYNALHAELRKTKLILAEHNHAYYSSGIKTPPDIRSALDLKIAHLNVEINELRPSVELLKDEARREKANAFLKSLIQECQANNLGHLVEKAKAESMKFIRDSGSLGAYTVTV